MKIFTGFPKLASLDFSESTGITDEAMETFALMPELQSLTLYNVPMTARGFSFLRQAKDIRTLGIGSDKLDDSCLEELVRMETLEMLVLNNALNITNEGLTKLASLPKLVSLIITDCPKITDGGLPRIARFDSLGYLRIKGEQYTDKALIYLKDHGKLNQLDIVGKTQITRKALRKFEKEMPHCKVTLAK